MTFVTTVANYQTTGSNDVSDTLAPGIPQEQSWRSSCWHRSCKNTMPESATLLKVCSITVAIKQLTANRDITDLAGWSSDCSSCLAVEVTEYLLVPLCECEANKISFSSCLQQPVIHLSKDCLDAVSRSQSPSWPSGHARLLPSLPVMPDSSLAFQSSQAPPQPSGHARLLLAFQSSQAPP